MAGSGPVAPVKKSADFRSRDRLAIQLQTGNLTDFHIMGAQHLTHDLVVAGCHRIQRLTAHEADPSPEGRSDMTGKQIQVEAHLLLGYAVQVLQEIRWEGRRGNAIVPSPQHGHIVQFPTGLFNQSLAGVRRKTGTVATQHKDIEIIDLCSRLLNQILVAQGHRIGVDDDHTALFRNPALRQAVAIILQAAPVLQKDDFGGLRQKMEAQVFELGPVIGFGIDFYVSEAGFARLGQQMGNHPGHQTFAAGLFRDGDAFDDILVQTAPGYDVAGFVFDGIPGLHRLQPETVFSEECLRFFPEGGQPQRPLLHGMESESCHGYKPLNIC